MIALEQMAGIAPALDRFEQLRVIAQGLYSFLSISRQSKNTQRSIEIPPSYPRFSVNAASATPIIQNFISSF